MVNKFNSHKAMTLYYKIQCVLLVNQLMQNKNKNIIFNISRSAQNILFISWFACNAHMDAQF
jgi:hypothetical protein